MMIQSQVRERLLSAIDGSSVASFPFPVCRTGLINGVGKGTAVVERRFLAPRESREISEGFSVCVRTVFWGAMWNRTIGSKPRRGRNVIPRHVSPGWMRKSDVSPGGTWLVTRKFIVYNSFQPCYYSSVKLMSKSRREGYEA